MIAELCETPLKKGKSCDRVFSNFYIVEVERCKPSKTQFCLGRQTFLAIGRECIVPVFPCNKEKTEKTLKAINSFVKKVPQQFSQYVKTVYPLFVFRRKASHIRPILEKALKQLAKETSLYLYFFPTLATASEYVKGAIRKDPESIAKLDNLAKIIIIKSTEMKEFRPLALLLVLAGASVALTFKLLDFEKFMEHIRRNEYGVALQIAHEGVLTAVSLKTFSLHEVDSVNQLINGADNMMSRKLEIVKEFLEAARESMCYAVPEDRENANAAVLPDGTVGIRFGAHIGYVEEMPDGRVKVTYIDHNIMRLNALTRYLKAVGYRVKENPNDAKIEITIERERLKELFRDLTLTMSVDILGCYDMFNTSSREELLKRKKECLRRVLGVDSLC